MISIHIDTVKLTAIALFAPKADIRRYLNGVYVEATSGHTRLAATDGLMMALHSHALPDASFKNDGVEWETLILPLDAVAFCKPAKGMPNIATVLIERTARQGINANDDDALDMRYTLRLWDGRSMPFVPVPGKFPDLRRVIPQAMADGAPGAQFNADMLNVFVKANKMLGEGTWGGTNLRITWGGPSTALRIHLKDPHFIGVLMPRTDAASSPFEKNFDRWPAMGPDAVQEVEDFKEQVA